MTFSDAGFLGILRVRIHPLCNLGMTVRKFFIPHEKDINSPVQVLPVKAVNVYFEIL